MTIDLESLRGFTPGPWIIPSMIGSSDAVAHASGYVCFTAIPRNVDEARQPGESWIDMRARTQQDRDAIAVEQAANARLIAAAPSMHAELTARRARDAEVEALVAAATPFVALLQGHNEFDHKRNPVRDNQPVFGINDVTIRIGDLRLLRAALLPFTGAKP